MKLLLFSYVVVSCFWPIANCEKWTWPVYELMNSSVDPCTDFYDYVCGNFPSLNERLPGENKVSQFSKNDIALTLKARAVLEKPVNFTKEDYNSSRAKVYRYFRSCMDVNTTDRNGVKAMRQMVRELGGFWFTADDDQLQVNFDITEELIRLTRFTSNGLFYWGVSSSRFNSSIYSIQVFQGGLSLGSNTRDYYMNKSIVEDTILSTYVDLLYDYTDIILGEREIVKREVDIKGEYYDDDVEGDPSGYIEDVVLFEQKLASIQSPKHVVRNHSLVYSDAEITHLNELVGFLNWTRYFKAIFDDIGVRIEDDEVIAIHATPYLVQLHFLIANMTSTPEGRRTLHNFFVYRAIDEYAKYFGPTFRAAYAKFSAVFQGSTGIPPTWRHCVGDTDVTIGFPLGAIFLEEYFSVEHKHQVMNLTKDVVAAFRKRLEGAHWMLNETRHFALRKLDALIYDVGYPDWILNTTYLDERYSNFTVTEDYASSQFHAFNYSFKYDLLKLHTVEDVKYEWYMTPQTANAYYAIHQNKFAMPAGLLDPPFYYKDDSVPSSMNFGAIAVIISHELSHSIDDRGKEFDEFGHLKMWWDNETSARFDERAKCIVDQFSDYEAEDGLHLRGAQIVGENIADSGAVRTAWDAYRHSEMAEVGNQTHLLSLNQSDDGIELTNDQLFFVGFGQMWCTSYTSESLRLAVLKDDHSPSHFRVFGTLSHFEPFSQVFNCPAGSKMNAPKKCELW